MRKQDVMEFLKFRRKFTAKEWFEMNQAVKLRENEKAAKLQLDDFDVDLIVNRLEKDPFSELCD